MIYYQYFIKSAVALILIFQLVRFISSGNNTDANVIDLAQLNRVYAQSLDLPISADSLEVLIYVYPEICGNSSVEELRSIFTPDLLEKPYLNTLNSKYKKLKIISEHHHSIENYKKHPLKISLEIWGDVKNRRLVEVWEKYNLGYKTNYGDKIISIEKICTFQYGKWSVKTHKTKLSYY
ncbi:MAG: hypothetical protein NW226_22125 [Microscillaceae bacterium]|nr:hypothetical protein [Microscillaceae bacterium]